MTAEYTQQALNKRIFELLKQRDAVLDDVSGALENVDIPLYIRMKITDSIRMCFEPEMAILTKMKMVAEWHELRMLAGAGDDRKAGE